MATNVAGEIEKEYGSLSVDIPTISFEFNIIGMAEKLSMLQKIYMAASTVFLFGLLFYINPPVIFSALLLLIILSVLFYNYYSLFDKVIIDFNHKEITLRNKFRIVTGIRKKIGKTVTLPFKAISHFEVQYSRFSFSSPTYSLLIVKSFDHAPMVIGSFQSERNARRLGELLQYHITGKPRTKLA